MKQPSTLLKYYGIVITGGIATGKSVFLKWLESLGYLVFDADLIAKDLLSPPSPIIKQVIDYFGPSILDVKNSINRKKLREIIFLHPQKKQKLEQILHPEINKSLRKQLLLTDLAQNPRIWFYEASLIFETKSESLFREIWVTHCPQKEQIKRLMKRDKCSLTMAKNIINSQWDNKLKAKNADFVIQTTAPLTKLKKQILERLTYV